MRHEVGAFGRFTRRLFRRGSAVRTRLDIAPDNEDLPLTPPEEETAENEDPNGLSIDISKLWGYLALAAGLALLPLAFLILRFRRRSTGGIRGATSEGLLPDPPSYLSRFRQACAQRGFPMPPGRTLRQQLHTLTKEGDEPKFASDLLEYHYAITYGNAKPNKLRESALNRAIKQWA